MDTQTVSKMKISFKKLQIQQNPNFRLVDLAFLNLIET